MTVKSFDLTRWRARDGRPLVFGHRGARHAAPENTLAAFQLALEEGAVGVELDVRLDADRSVIVLHDLDLARVTSGEDRRPAAALRRADFERIDLGNGAHVPELGAVLSWAKESGALLNIELKSDLIDRKGLLANTAQALRTSAVRSDQVLVSSFHLPMLRAFSKAVPEVPTAWLFDRAWLGKTPVVWASGAVAAHPWSALINRGRLEVWRRHCDLVNTWTVNDTGEAQRLAALGVDALLTDTPRAILEAIQSHSPR